MSNQTINAHCYICGNGYYKCYSCKDMEHIAPWKTVTDTSEHFKIFQILKGYSTKVYSATEAWDKLQKVELSDMDSFNDNVKEQINTIMEEAKKLGDTKKESRPVSSRVSRRMSKRLSEDVENNNESSEEKVIEV